MTAQVTDLVRNAHGSVAALVMKDQLRSAYTSGAGVVLTFVLARGAETKTYSV